MTKKIKIKQHADHLQHASFFFLQSWIEPHRDRQVIESTKSLLGTPSLTYQVPDMGWLQSKKAGTDVPDGTDLTNHSFDFSIPFKAGKSVGM
jgi:hypothetical protein